ncbi:hypothetical protein CJO92_19410 (plasmid) [Ralstonia solanacearum]|nr:hypothetical protein CJO92_19410 [Ralstonia solanacearum]
MWLPFSVQVDYVLMLGRRTHGAALSRLARRVAAMRVVWPVGWMLLPTCASGSAQSRTRDVGAATVLTERTTVRKGGSIGTRYDDCDSDRA